MEFDNVQAGAPLPLDNNFKRLLKRAFDLVGSVILIIFLSPFLLTIYILIRKTGSQVIFQHQRVGSGGELFGCLKFWTMMVNAQEVLEDILKNDPLAKAEWERDFKLKNDPRVTSVGQFLRKTSLDELPQLFNVLRGEMSLVGPRPVIDKEIERYGDAARFYYSVRPGMTGLWQVSGRNDISYGHRVNMDVEYVVEWSFMKDINILVKTIGVVVFRKGSY